MKTVINEYKLNTAIPKILDTYFGGMRVGVFDIETLGLDPRSTAMILSGIVEIADTHETAQGLKEGESIVRATQYFCEDPSEEAEVLEKTLEHLSAFDYIVTYNGRHFDIPFVSKRAKLHHLEGFKPNLYNLDIYLVLNGHSPFKKLLPNLKQKTVEEYFGLCESRADEISGKESIDFYYSYLNCTDMQEKAEMERQILLHNHDDIVQLFRLIPALRKCDIHKAFSKLGFPVRGIEDIPAGISWENVTVDSIKINSRNLEIAGRYGGEAVSYIGFNTWDHPYECTLKNDMTYEITCPVSGEKGSVYADLQEMQIDTESFEKLENYVNGYLILKEKDEVHYRELNALARELVFKMMSDTHL